MKDSEDKKIKNTRLGGWLKGKAPKILDVVGDLLPDQGAPRHSKEYVGQGARH